MDLYKLKTMNCFILLFYPYIIGEIRTHNNNNFIITIMINDDDNSKFNGYSYFKNILGS